MKNQNLLLVISCVAMYSLQASQSYGPHKELAPELYAITIKNNSKKRLLYTMNNQDLLTLPKGKTDLPMIKAGTTLTIYEIETSGSQAAQNIETIYSRPIQKNKVITIKDSKLAKQGFEITESH